MVARILTWQALPPSEPRPIPATSHRQPSRRPLQSPPSTPPAAPIPQPTPVVLSGAPRIGRIPAADPVTIAAAPTLAPAPIPAPDPAPPSPGPEPLSPPAGPAPLSPPRWSFAAWLLWRPGDGQAAIALPAYGASQAGAVLHYRLAAAPGAPVVYLRAATALAAAPGVRADGDLALGIGQRPVAGLPLRARLEARADRLGRGQIRARAAVMLVSELPTLSLPGHSHAELYAQAGYVAGEAATGFVDAALRVEHPLAMLGHASLLAGSALSGGAQQGAGRLDLGPALTVALDRGPLHARAALEYRVRLAGQARPGTGPTLTITAGF